MTRRPVPICTLFEALLVAALFMAGAPMLARAEVSANDGFAPDGSYQWHFELAPYGWLPASSTHIKLGNGASANISAGIPSISELRNVVTGVFMGFGIVRYGPWSAQLNIDYLAASQTKGLPPGPLGLIGRSLDISTSLVRVAPGFGYQVFRGTLGPVPATVDGMLGFSYFTHIPTLDLSRFGPRGQPLFVSTLSGSADFVQPWLGFRASIYPWPRWRFELQAMVQGLGVDGGAWGWGAGVYATWAATRWLNLIAGFNALSSQGRSGSGTLIKSISFTEYGPLIGMSFTF